MSGEGCPSEGLSDVLQSVASFGNTPPLRYVMRSLFNQAGVSVCAFGFGELPHQNCWLCCFSGGA